MWTKLMTIALLLLSVGCQDAVTDPDISEPPVIDGTYTLVSVNGEELPADWQGPTLVIRSAFMLINGSYFRREYTLASVNTTGGGGSCCFHEEIEGSVTQEEGGILFTSEEDTIHAEHVTNGIFVPNDVRPKNASTTWEVRK